MSKVGNKKGLTVRNRIILLAVALSCISLLIGASGAIASQMLVARIRSDAARVSLVRHAHIDLLQAIQELKNILLRGQNQDDFIKYSKATAAESEAVNAEL